MKQKKTVIASFEYVFVRLTIETEAQHKIYSSSEQDLMFFVYDNDVTDEQYLLDIKRLTETTFNSTYQADVEWKKSQRRFYDSDEECDARYDEIVNTLLNDFKEIDDYHTYEFVSV